MKMYCTQDMKFPKKRFLEIPGSGIDEKKTWSQMGMWHFKLLAWVRHCPPTSVKQPAPCAPLLTYLFPWSYHWLDWMLFPACLQVTGSWLLSLGFLIPTVTQDEPKHRFAPPPSFPLVPQLLLSVPVSLLVLPSPPRSLSLSLQLQSTQEASPGAYVSIQRPRPWCRSKGGIISGFNLASLLQGLPQGVGWKLFPPGWFPKSLSRVGPPLPTKQALAERPSSPLPHFWGVRPVWDLWFSKNGFWMAFRLSQVIHWCFFCVDSHFDFTTELRPLLLPGQGSWCIPLQLRQLLC